uniref:Uncharacterized protein n=1 Tax=Timema monikensis TaxID=170555 RepID=A0A7R9HIC7_9NEOP|nr:unnamed protein product [Timema monikensis]
MAQLIRDIIHGYHDVMDNKSDKCDSNRSHDLIDEYVKVDLLLTPGRNSNPDIPIPDRPDKTSMTTGVHHVASYGCELVVFGSDCGCLYGVWGHGCSPPRAAATLQHVIIL